MKTLKTFLSELEALEEKATMGRSMLSTRETRILFKICELQERAIFSIARNRDFSRSIEETFNDVREEITKMLNESEGE